MKIHRLFIKTHRILGICLSILFLMWFVSGIVMMYHTYPRVEKEQALAFAEDIDTVLLPIQNLVEELPLRDPVKSISLNKRAGENVIRISTEEEEFLLNARTGLPIGKFSSGQLQQIANRWSSGDAMLKDTLNEIDVWLIGAYPFKDFPVYHYCFPDEEKGELYLSSRTGDALQFTTWKSRFWAWVGAIPHWIYVKQFRAHGRQPWKDIVLWVSGIGILMTLSGIYVGIRSFRIARKKHHTGTPYRKGLFLWHHLAGLCFVLFTLTWIFSGFMSLAQVPQWISKVHEPRNVRDEINGSSLALDAYRLDCQRILEQEGIKNLTWTSLGGYPCYKVETEKETYLVDATIPSEVRRLEVDETFCREMMQHIRGKEVPVEVSLLTEYDNYYISLKNALPLPVYKIKVRDADKSCYYLDPVDGSCRYFNENTRYRVWMYKGLHCFSTVFFARHHTLRDVLMWILLLGGCVLSVTGVILSIRYVSRN